MSAAAPVCIGRLGYDPEDAHSVMVAPERAALGGRGRAGEHGGAAGPSPSVDRAPLVAALAGGLRFCLPELS